MALIKERNPNAAITLDYSHRPLAEQLDKGARQLEIDPSDDPQGGLFATPLVRKMLLEQGRRAASLRSFRSWRSRASR